jgi:hypothetical protein
MHYRVVHGNRCSYSIEHVSYGAMFRNKES